MRRHAEVATVGLMLGRNADRRLLHDFLRESGFSVLDVELLAQRGAAPPPLDLIVVDEEWAGHAGPCLEDWKRRAHPLQLPVLVLLSAQSGALRWLSSGFDDVLRQPVGKDELLARVHAFLRLRRASEQANVQNEARFRATLDSAPVGIAHCTLDGRFMRVNAKLCEILGMDEATLVTRRLQDVAPGGIAAQTWAALGARPQLQYEALRPNGRAAPAWLKITVSPLDADRTPEYLVAIVEDVTAQKRAEASLQTLNADLERRVAERTAELRAANDELEAFTASVSHDLRAPLRAIEVFTDQLISQRAELLPGPSGHLLLRVRAAATRMGQLIDGLLGLSRASRAQLHRVRVDLAMIARAVVADLRLQAPERRVNVTIHENMLCSGDPVLLRQVVDNLLGNAWKYTACRSEAEIEFGVRDVEGTREFFVRDNGAGFDMAYATKLFSPFERLHSESEFPGVGMGLATVRRIIERHGGRIRGEGKPGIGATFRFAL